MHLFRTYAATLSVLQSDKPAKQHAMKPLTHIVRQRLLAIFKRQLLVVAPELSPPRQVLYSDAVFAVFSASLAALASFLFALVRSSSSFVDA